MFAPGSMAAAMIVISLLSLMSIGQCSLLRPLVCDGGRAEGDKWFDGCQWCVCQLDGPVCSPRECSSYVAHVAPCDNLRSRWRDGCYHCSCGISGIECRADRACLAHVRAGGDEPFLSGGRCEDTADFRCVCGLDGIPSCSEKVMGDLDFTKTLIALNVTSPTSIHLTSLGPHPRQHGRYRQPRDQGVVRSRSKRRAGRGGYREGRTRHGHGASLVSYREGVTIDFLPEAPPHLLMATDDQCPLGPRWYAGSVRCYCDDSGSVTCGDPSFVAGYIDGFLAEKRRCEEGHVWEDESSCRSCECLSTRLVLCQRSPLCPLPFLVQGSTPSDSLREEFRAGQEEIWPRAPQEDLEEEEEEIDFPGTTQDGSGSSSKHVGGQGSSGVSLTLDGKDKDDEIVIDLDLDSGEDSNLILDKDDDMEDGLKTDGMGNRRPGDKRADRGGSNNGGSGKSYSTVVTVRECRPGRRWRQGCKLCSCSSKGRKRCNDKRCPKPSVPKPPRGWGNGSTVAGRPIQRPPPVPPHLRRLKPLGVPKPPALVSPCGKYTVGQRYWKQCNLCLCTKKGPRCTAMNCG